MNRLIELEQELFGKKTRNRRELRNELGEKNNAAKGKSFSDHFSSGLSSPVSQTIDYKVPGIVPVFRQAYPDACWAAAATMMYSWKDGVSYDPQELMDRIGKTWGDMYRKKEGMSPDLEDRFIKDAGFESVRQFNPTLQTWVQMLKDCGPLSVVMDSPSLGHSVHTTVLTGIKGDGSSNSIVTFIDPGDGEEHQTSFEKFRGLFEKTAHYPIQIIHWPKGARSVQQTMLGARAFTKKVTGIFKQEEIDRMKDFLVENATGPRGPKNCIDTVNQALSLLLADSSLPSGTSIQASMKELVSVGLASQPEIIEFLDASGEMTKGIKRPEKLSQNVYDTLASLSNNESNWSVFGMSILDGYHSVLISYDNSNPAKKMAYWSDQWPSKGGWKYYDSSALDAEITTLTQQWWDKVLAEKGAKYKTRLTLWRIFKRTKD